MNKNVPKLRFKEFDDGWRKQSLGEIFKVYAGGDIKEENFSKEKREEYVYPVYSNTLIADGLHGYSNLYRFEGENITVTGRGVNTGIAKARCEKYFPIIRLLTLEPKINLNIKYFEEVINRTKIFIESTGVPQLTGPQISKVQVYYPSLQEQEKIADFFTILDSLIEEQDGKVSDLELYKKGMMQKIFSQEIRFKDENGCNYPEWEEKNLGSISEITKLAGFEFTEFVEYSDIGEKIALRGLNIKDGKLNLDDVKYIDNSNFSKLNRSKLYKDDLLLTYVGTIGNLAIVDQNDKYYLAPNVCRIRVQNQNAKFVKYFMSTKEFYYRIITPLITTSSQPALSMENIRVFKIKLPILQEQIKIVNFLSNIDNLIEEEKKNLDDLRTMKKGLLQQMFV